MDSRLTFLFFALSLVAVFATTETFKILLQTNYEYIRLR